jgi:hypothetical protein
VADERWTMCVRREGCCLLREMIRSIAEASKESGRERRNVSYDRGLGVMDSGASLELECNSA